jgi:nucleotide-binding universal stress UspA family protein
MSVLLALDGEPHTAAAVAWALEWARARSLPITALHVKDPYLKQFENEIYAQGREEYVAHVERCLSERAEQLIAEFAAAAGEHGVPFETLILAGDPVATVLEQATSGRYSLLVLGRKRLRGVAAWCSRDLPGKLAATCHRASPGIVIIPEAVAAEK